MTTAKTNFADPGSFRDPAGRIYRTPHGVFRTVSPDAWPNVEKLDASGVLQQLAAAEKLWPARILAPGEVPEELAAIVQNSDAHVLEHPVLPFVSYPYEWPFSLLKRAALLHLDLQLEALDRGFTLIDGTAYNVQFVGVRPVFIDTLSLVAYEEGDYWLGYRQFCEQFLNPLLLMAKLGIAYHPWFRGNLEGIGIEETARLLPWHKSLSLGVLSHVVLHARLTASARKAGAGAGGGRSQAKLKKVGLIGLLRGMRRLIAGLKPSGLSATQWRDYENNNSYDAAETAAKHAFISTFLTGSRPSVLWDMGCNAGAYSELALDAGVESVIGFDFDLGALEAAVSRADEQKLNLLPLHLDATNPSPSQGWRQRERTGLQERKNADAVLALAFLHHLVIGKNIPFPDAIDWLLSLASTGVIEFVPKEDPMVRQMLAQRKDIFPDYDVATFRNLLSSRASIGSEKVVSESGRTLFGYTQEIHGQ
jgi:ribosomal protein L11 methylase PrmA